MGSFIQDVVDRAQRLSAPCLLNVLVVAYFLASNVILVDRMPVTITLSHDVIHLHLLTTIMRSDNKFRFTILFDDPNVRQSDPTDCY